MGKRPESKVRKIGTFKDEIEDDVEDIEFVKCINDKVIESDKPIETKKELVIPLIVNNNWRDRKRKNETKNNKDEDSRGEMNGEHKQKTDEEKLEELARKELLKEAQTENENREKRKDIYSTRVIPMLVQNQVPQGFETDDKLDVSLRAEEPCVSDYEKVPVEEFGLAMLRGMGWKPGAGVGKNGKVVQPVEVKIRAKGLGLGAERELHDKKSSKSVPKSEEQEELVLKLGAFVFVQIGEYSKTYGVVESLDDDLTRAVIRPAISGSTFAVPTAALRIVSKSEYLKDSKVINKSKYEEYKVKTEKRINSQRRERHPY
ncbi:G patch domain and KOW motifs-containing protein-like protein [Leptotrombidium deliense]|uniref:G patch domain and KOW motifs-containing protein-like protein n=1 Tax=Leptotrombidium deliense TaxID=299467 RepID=A0A443RVY6_9ACAR|nr:G patch domain and KOW motifs-containing protein-like protein [Leptotrombidium deliense]